MSDLASQIIKNTEEAKSRKTAKGEAEEGDVDELGLVVHNNLDYICARVLKQHPNLYRSGRDIYDDSFVVPQNMQYFVVYNGGRSKLIDRYTLFLFWNKLRDLLPEKSNNKYQVSDRIFWNRETGKLEYKEDYGRGSQATERDN